MIRAVAFAMASATALALGGCAPYTPAQAQAAAQSDQHRTAASGFGLGPEDYRTNGGAFGPDQGDR